LEGIPEFNMMQNHRGDESKLFLGASDHKVTQNQADGIQSLLYSDTLLSELELTRKAIAQTGSTFGATLRSIQLRNSAARKYQYLNTTGLITNSYPLSWLHPNFTQASLLSSYVPGISYSNKLRELLDSICLTNNNNRLNSVFTNVSNPLVLSELLQPHEDRNELDRTASTIPYFRHRAGPTWDDYNAVDTHQKDGHPQEMERKASRNNVMAKTKRKHRKLKSKDTPKRPLSAYNLFFKDERAKILSEIPEGDKAVHFLKKSRARRRIPHGKIGFESLAKEIGQRWHSLDPLRVEYYKKLASQDMKRYLREMEDFRKKTKTMKDIVASEKKD
jgi:HMG-box domain